MSPHDAPTQTAPVETDRQTYLFPKTIRRRRPNRGVRSPEDKDAKTKASQVAREAFSRATKQVAAGTTRFDALYSEEHIRKIVEGEIRATARDWYPTAEIPLDDFNDLKQIAWAKIASQIDAKYADQGLKWGAVAWAKKVARNAVLDHYKYLHARKRDISHEVSLSTDDHNPELSDQYVTRSKPTASEIEAATDDGYSGISGAKEAYDRYVGALWQGGLGGKRVRYRQPKWDRHSVLPNLGYGLGMVSNPNERRELFESDDTERTIPIDDGLDDPID
jgi:hypothetical protein